MSIEFKKEPLSFEMVIREYGPSGYEEKAKHFREHGLNLPGAQEARLRSGDSYDTYAISANGAVDCFKACVVTVSDFLYNNDDEFCTWSANALYALSQVSKTDRRELAAIEGDFKNVQYRKNKELIKIQNQLRSIAQTFTLDDSFLKFPTLTEANTHNDIFEQNKLLIEENNKLYRQIIEEARKEAGQYNSSALKAIILSLSMDYVGRHKSSVLEQAKTAYKNYLNPPEESTNIDPNSRPLVAPVQLPEPGIIHPFLEPEKEFPHLKGDDSGSIKPENSVYARNRVTITKSAVKELAEKVNHLFENHQKCQKEQKGWLKFLTTVKNVFGDIYKRIIKVLNGAKQSTNPVEKHSDLAENIENITNGGEVSRTAQLIHRFNSRPSPLVHVIYDQELTKEEREDLLTKLAQARPYRFKYETQETRKNIDIPAQSLSSSGSFSPDGSPLHHAVKHGTASMVKILLENSADPNVRGMCISVNAIDHHEVTPLHIAVSEGDFDKVKLLLEHGADVNAINAIGQTPLHAVSNVEILKLLIQHGANINQKDKNGQTPLHFAVKLGKQDIVKVLLEDKKLQVDLQDNFGNTALHLAAATSFEMSTSRWKPSYSFAGADNQSKKTENLGIMSGLIQKGANVNQANSRGYTPLHMAVMDGQGTIDYDWVQNNKKLLDYQHVQNQVQLLCDNGAEVNAVSGKYETKKNDFVSSERDQHPAPMTTPLLALYTYNSHDAQRNKELTQGRLKVAKYLIERGAKYNLTYQQSVATNGIYQQEGNTLLHQCARLADTQAFAHFAKLGLDPNYQASSKHNTPFYEYLHWHTSSYDWRNNGAVEMQVFFDNGVDVNKTRDVKVTIDLNTLNTNLRSPLSLSTISAIFKHDNIISQKAKAMGLEVNDKNGREVLRKVYQKILDESHKGQHVALEITVPLTALEYSYTGLGELVPAREAAEMVEKQSALSPTKPNFNP